MASNDSPAHGEHADDTSYPKNAAQAVVSRISDSFKAALTALVAVLAAAFPTVYQLEPDLATGPGFMSSAKWPLFVLWALFLMWIGYRLTIGQIRDGGALSRKASEIDRALRDVASDIEQKFDSQLAQLTHAVGRIQVLQSGLNETADGIAEIERIVQLAAMEQELAHRIRVAAQVKNPLKPLEPIDDVAIVSVFASGNPTLPHHQCYPPKELPDPRTVRAIENVLHLRAPGEIGDARLIELNDGQRDRLPPRWHPCADVLVAPIWSSTADYVGSIVVAFPFTIGSVERPDGPFRDYVARCRNMSEDIAPILERVVGELWITELDASTEIERGRS